MNRDIVYSERNIKQAFDIIDKDKSGFISLDEIEQLINDPDNNYATSWIQMLKESVDDNEEISFPAFQTLMRNSRKN
jgi:Ca2+-binding EF-hand superfamily protein